MLSHDASSTGLRSEIRILCYGVVGISKQNGQKEMLIVTNLVFAPKFKKKDCISTPSRQNFRLEMTHYEILSSQLRQKQIRTERRF